MNIPAISMNISALPKILAPQPELVGQAAPAGGQFHQLLNSAIAQVESSHAAASGHVASFLAGGAGDLHATILAVQRADLEFEMMMQLRNKVVSAYQEIMRMQM